MTLKIKFVMVFLSYLEIRLLTVQVRSSITKLDSESRTVSRKQNFPKIVTIFWKVK